MGVSHTHMHEYTAQMDFTVIELNWINTEKKYIFKQKLIINTEKKYIFKQKLIKS